MKRLFALAALASLTSCVGMAGYMGAHLNAYEGPEKPDQQVATLTSTKDSASFGYAMLSKVDGKTYGDNLMRGYPKIVKVLPGRHHVTVKCIVSNKYAFPSVTVEFEAAHTYELGCRDIGGYAQASYVDRGVNAPDASAR